MEVYETICKIGTGFSDEVLQKAYEFFQDKIAPSMPKQYRISEGDSVDVWFTPSAVWEVKGADFQVSMLLYSCHPFILVELVMLTRIEESDCGFLVWWKYEMTRNLTRLQVANSCLIFTVSKRSLKTTIKLNSKMIFIDEQNYCQSISSSSSIFKLLTIDLIEFFLLLLALWRELFLILPHLKSKGVFQQAKRAMACAHGQHFVSFDTLKEAKVKVFAPTYTGTIVDTLFNFYLDRRRLLKIPFIDTVRTKQGRFGNCGLFLT